MTFKEEVKDSARGRWPELLIEIGGIHRDFLSGKHSPCPRCGGRDRFRLIDEQEGAVLCNVCFSEKNGDGFAAIGWMLGVGFADALSLVADHLGIKKKRAKKKPDEVLRFEEWRSDRAEWCDKKGIDQQTVIDEGGRMADWRSRRVIAIPILGTTAESKPRGYAIVNAMGGTLPSRAGDAKILVTEGSTTGWIGKSSLARLEGAVCVWKVEGVTDQLALSQAIPAEQRQRHAVVTNPFGSKENPKKHLLKIFAGKLVAVIHDPDDAGEKGAAKWAAAIAAVAKEVRIVRLPGGKDLRDWLAVGGTFNELRALARAAAVITDGSRPGEKGQRKDRPSSNDVITSDNVSEVEEEDDDHIRLAKLFIRQRVRRFLIHQGAPHFWIDHRWHRFSTIDDLRSSVLKFLVQEFDRLAMEKAEASAKKDEDLPKRKRINAQLLGSVMTMVRSFASIPTGIPYGSMLERDEDGSVEGSKRRNLISFSNALVDLDELLENGSAAAVDEHTPDWWSLVHLPYAFEPDAPIGPYWTSFLRMNLAGDEKLIACLQEWMGYCLMPNTDHHRFLMMIGEGANGKSVFCAVLEALLGEENVSHVPLELFGQRFALASSLGCLANVAMETHDLDKVSEGYLKQFTDGSKMMFDRKGLPAIEARPTAKLVIATNQPPRFTDKSMGLWRRMLVAPFAVEIKAQERLLGLDKSDWWLNQGELPGLFNWAVEGLRRLEVQAAFTVPKVAEVAKVEYRKDINPAREFLEGFYEETTSETGIDLYLEYEKWCKTSGHKPLGSRMFGREVKRVFSRSEPKKSGSTNESGKRPTVYINIQENQHWED